MAYNITYKVDFSSLLPIDYPPLGAHIIGTDIDGKLKQMDSNGVIEFVGVTGPTGDNGTNGVTMTGGTADTINGTATYYDNDGGSFNVTGYTKEGGGGDILGNMIIATRASLQLNHAAWDITLNSETIKNLTLSGVRMYSDSVNFEGGVGEITETFDMPNMIEYIGQEFIVTAVSGLTSISAPKLEVLTPMHLASENFFDGMPDLITLNFPKLRVAQSFIVDSCAILPIVDLPELTDSCLFAVVGCASVVTINTPKLVNGVLGWIIEANTSLTTINAPLFSGGTDEFSVSDNPSLVVSDFPSLTLVADYVVRRNSSLTTLIVASALTTSVGGSVVVTDNNLTAETQTDLLAALIAGGAINGVYNASNLLTGTNAPLNAAGLIHKGTLEAAGWTVTGA